MKAFQSILSISRLLLLLWQTKTAKALCVRNHRPEYFPVPIRQFNDNDCRYRRFEVVPRCNGLYLSCRQSNVSCSESQGKQIGRREDGNQINTENDQTRRAFLSRTAFSISGGSAVLGTIFPTEANARGLVLFPCREPLLNSYHFMRAGASLLEVEDVWSTNPLFL